MHVDEGRWDMPRNGGDRACIRVTNLSQKVKHWGFRPGTEPVEWAPGSARGGPGELHQDQSGPLVQTPRLLGSAFKAI